MSPPAEAHTPSSTGSSSADDYSSANQHGVQTPATPATPASAASVGFMLDDQSKDSQSQAAAAAAKRKPSRRANTAERRATHNAVERQRRETLNGRFLDLAALLPNLASVRRPSKSAIVNSSIAIIHQLRRQRLLAARELRVMKVESDALRRELNEWRDRSCLPRVEEPQRSGECLALLGMSEGGSSPSGSIMGGGSSGSAGGSPAASGMGSGGSPNSGAGEYYVMQQQAAAHQAAQLGGAFVPSPQQSAMQSAALFGWETNPEVMGEEERRAYEMVLRENEFGGAGAGLGGDDMDDMDDGLDSSGVREDDDEFVSGGVGFISGGGRAFGSTGSLRSAGAGGAGAGPASVASLSSISSFGSQGQQQQQQQQQQAMNFRQQQQTVQQQAILARAAQMGFTTATGNDPTALGLGHHPMGHMSQPTLSTVFEHPGQQQQQQQQQQQMGGGFAAQMQQIQGMSMTDKLAAWSAGLEIQPPQWAHQVSSSPGQGTQGQGQQGQQQVFSPPGSAHSAASSGYGMGGGLMGMGMGVGGGMMHPHSHHQLFQQQTAHPHHMYGSPEADETSSISSLDAASHPPPSAGGLSSVSAGGSPHPQHSQQGQQQQQQLSGLGRSISQGGYPRSATGVGKPSLSPLATAGIGQVQQGAASSAGVQQGQQGGGRHLGGVMSIML